jgi:DNA-binding LytR/AlgR family response regulator
MNQLNGYSELGFPVGEIKFYYSKITFSINEIIYLESNINYTIFHLTNGKRYTSSFTLKYHVENMKEEFYFFRINRSICVNMNYVSSMDKSKIWLNNGLEFPISRRRQKYLVQQISH